MSRTTRTRALTLLRVAALALGAVLSASIGLGSLHPTGANAGFPNQLPFMCFNTGNTFHQTFGPISFFLNETQQGPTSFQEGPPTSKPVVILPLHRGAAAGHLVYYVITDAGDKAHWADKVKSVDAVNNTVSYEETNGCYEDMSVHYASFDSSAFGPAAVEDVTYARALGSVPFVECGTNDINVEGPFINPGCARESLIAFINGQTGKDNIQRQGLNAALLDGESPLNILEDVPNNGAQFNYSPMWDIHLVQWKDSVPVANRLRQTDFATAEALVGTQAQSITPDGTASNTFQATGFIVNCPLISIFADK